MRLPVLIGTGLLIAISRGEGQLVLQNRTLSPLQGEVEVMADPPSSPRPFELRAKGAGQVANWSGDPPKQIRVTWNGQTRVLTGPVPESHRGRLTWHLWLFADRAEIKLSPPPRPEPEKRDGVVAFAYFGAAPLTLVAIGLAIRAKRKQANGKPIDKPIILS